MDLNKPIGRSAASQKLPSKRIINLAIRENKKTSFANVVPLVILGFLVIVLLLKIGVMDPYIKATELEGQAAREEQSLLDLQTQMSDYEEVLDEYEGYKLDSIAYGGAKVATMQCLAIIEKYLLPASEVQDFSVSGEFITVSMGGVTLNQISDIYSALREDELVSGVDLYTANYNEEDGAASTSCTMTIFLISEEPEVTEE